MATDMENRLESSIRDLEKLVEQVIELDPSLDPRSSTVLDFNKYTNLETLRKGLESSFKSSELLVELAFSRYLADLINLNSSDNGYHFKEVGVLIDYSLYLHGVGAVAAELPILLLTWSIKDSTVEWLVDFWPYFEYRYHVIRANPSFESFGKPHLLNLLISLNHKLQLLSNSFEISREVLRGKILNLVNSIYPLFPKHLSNRKFESNTERLNDLKSNLSKAQGSLPRLFWRLQIFFQDPLAPFTKEGKDHLRNKLSDARYDMNAILHEIRSIEEKLNGYPLQAVRNDNDAINEKDHYEKRSLPESKRQELQEFFDNKVFNPNFYIEEDERFRDQLRRDRYLRRSILTQIYIVSGLYESLSHIIKKVPPPPATDKPDDVLRIRIAQDYFSAAKDAPKYAQRGRHAVVSFLDLKKDSQFIFQALERRCSFANSEIRDFSEGNFLNAKLGQFVSFIKVNDSFEINKDFEESLRKNAEFKPKYWAAYGTREITTHWKVETGLASLSKPETEGNVEQIDLKIQELREKIKNENNDSTKDYLNWKSLRLARRNHFFEFQNVLEETGVEGIFDPTLRGSIETKKAEELIKKKEEELEKAEAKRLEDEKFLKEEEERKAKKEEEEEKKRKADQEQFQEESKRARLESAHSNANTSTDLDY